MTTKTIPLNNGTHIPWLAFGTGSALFQKDSEQPVRAAIQNGIVHLDGAQVYENEDSLGAGIKASGKPRSGLYIVTKLNFTLPPGQTARQSLEESLKKLGTDYVDLFLIHNPEAARKIWKLPDLWKELETIQKDGLAKTIGVSNFGVDDLKEIMQEATIIPAVNQIEFHPYVLDTAEAVVKFGKEHGIVTASFAALTPITHASGGPLDPVLSRIRERLETDRKKPVTVGQVLAKWLLQSGIIFVTTTNKVERIKEFIDVEGIPELTAEEIKEIETVGKRLHKKVY